MDTAFKKGTAGLRDGNGLISLKAILKYKHGSLPQKNKLSRELAKQAVITKCRVKYQGGAKPCLYKNKAVDFRAKYYISDSVLKD